jgi:RNA polymerase sigma factor (sigma-70 family)
MQTLPNTNSKLLRDLVSSGEQGSREWQENWELFFLTYYPVVLRWCRQWDSSQADDLSQDVMLLLVRNIGAYDRKKGKFRSWLKTVVSHAVLSALRTRHRHALPLESVAVEDLEAQALASLERDLEQTPDLSPRVASCLERVRQGVDPRNWEAFLQFKIEGRPVAAVAAELGTTTRAVYVNTLRIYRTLVDELGLRNGPAE